MELAVPFCIPRGEVEALRHAEAQLRRLLDPAGPPEGAVELLAREKDAAPEVHDLLVQCVSEPGLPERPFTELEALTLLVRLLGVGAGDLRGDEVWPAELLRGWVQEESSLSRLLRAETAVRAVLGLLGRHSQAFAKGLEPFLRLEALRALRLQLARPPQEVGLPPAWWADQQVAGDLPRELLDAAMAALHGVSAGQLSRRPQVAVLGALCSVVSASATCHQRAVQQGGVELTVGALRSMLRCFGPPVEAAVTACCDLLSLMASGEDWNTMQVAQTGVHRDVLELLKRFGHYRGIACNAFVLLGIVVNDSNVVQCIMDEGPDKLFVASQARTRWPGELQHALHSAPKRASPALLAALDTSPWTLALQHRLLQKAGKVIMNVPGGDCDRPHTQSTACPSSLNNTMMQSQENPLANLRLSPTPSEEDSFMPIGSPSSTRSADLAVVAVAEALRTPLASPDVAQAEPELVAEVDDEETSALILQIQLMVGAAGNVAAPSCPGTEAETARSCTGTPRGTEETAQETVAMLQSRILAGSPDGEVLQGRPGSRVETVLSHTTTEEDAIATVQDVLGVFEQGKAPAGSESPPPTRPDSRAGIAPSQVDSEQGVAKTVQETLAFIHDRFRTDSPDSLLFPGGSDPSRVETVHSLGGTDSTVAMQAAGDDPALLTRALVDATSCGAFAAAAPSAEAVQAYSEVADAESRIADEEADHIAAAALVAALAEAVP